MKSKKPKAALVRTKIRGVYISIGIAHSRGPLDINAIADRLADPLKETKKHKGPLPPWPVID